MALAFDAVSSKSGQIFWPGDATLAHTCTGSDRILIVNAGVHANASNVTGITYAGVAMTLSTSQIYNADNVKVYQYYLINPASGANNIVVSYDASVDYSVWGISLTGADQTSPKWAVWGGNGASNSAPSNNITTTSANSFIIAWVTWGGRTAGACSATGTNQTTRYAIDNAGVNIEAGGSTQTTTTAGSYTSSWTWGAAAWYAHALTEIKEVQLASRKSLSLLWVS